MNDYINNLLNAPDWNVTLRSSKGDHKVKVRKTVEQDQAADTARQFILTTRGVHAKIKSIEQCK